MYRKYSFFIKIFNMSPLMMAGANVSEIKVLKHTLILIFAPPGFGFSHKHSLEQTNDLSREALLQMIWKFPKQFMIGQLLSKSLLENQYVIHTFLTTTLTILLSFIYSENVGWQFHSGICLSNFTYNNPATPC